MTVLELKSIEVEVLDGLRARAAQGDNEAARVALEHLRAQSKAIAEWRERKDAVEKKGKHK